MLRLRNDFPRAVLLVVSSVVAVIVPACEQSSQHEPVALSRGVAVTFARDVAPIVFEKCATCHHPGEAAPFSLLTYDDVRRRAGQIVDVTHKRFMPPWLPTEGQDVFVGARRLSDRELQVFERWLDAGTPLGNPADVPAAPVVTNGWQTGTPDVVLESATYTLASEGRDVFRNFVVPLPLDRPRWVQSIELRPVNPRVTHHARLGVDRSGESFRRESNDGQPGYPGMAWGQDPDGQLVIWAPGMVAKPGTPGVAWRLDPDTCLVLHTHLQPSGKTETTKFLIGLHFADAPPVEHPAILRLGSCDVDIAAGESHHVVTGEYKVPIDVDLHMIFPHAHSLCTALSAVAVRPDGTREPLISIEHFDENWHESYDYRRPVRLPKGTQVLTTFAYDNTDKNPRNRNRPARRVVYGSNVTDEMADVYLQVTPVHADQRAVLMEDFKKYELKSQLVGLRNSLAVYQDDPWVLEGIAACDVGLGKPKDAVAVLQRRLRTGPTAVFPIASLGLALSASGDFAGAETQERRAVAMDGKYALAWFGLGRALFAQKEFKPAGEAYRKAVELTPSLLDARLALADVLIERGEWDDAATLCSAANIDSPDMANVELKLAEIQAQQGRYEESLKHCEQARRLAPYTHPAKVLLAVFCFQNGDESSARKFLREARTESPDHPMPPLMLGQLARRDGQLEEARRLLASAASKAIPENWPDSHRQRFLVLLQSERFQLAQQLQDLDLARDALSQWIKCDPENRQLQVMYDKLQAESSH